MPEPTPAFGESATRLARNPIGIIALFITLVYGFASLVTAFGGGLTSSEKLPLIYFLVLFPFFILVVFSWLVSSHSGKLFAPSDFRDETNYVRVQLAAASLTAAKSKGGATEAETSFQQILDVARETLPTRTHRGAKWDNHVMWVDDHPDNNTWERRAFEAVGLIITLAQSTSEAMDLISRRKFAAIISDMARREGPREGYALLDRLRSCGNSTPLFFYSSSSAPEHKRETIEHGGQGCTSDAQELFRLVTKTVIEQKGN